MYGDYRIKKNGNKDLDTHETLGKMHCAKMNDPALHSNPKN